VKIAILSGKGGTGKTLVSVNLSVAAKKSLYIDCDVEEPNGHLFFKPKYITSSEVTIKMPYVDQKLCIGCRACVDFCKFNAIAYIYNKTLFFEDICHSCGGCMLVCPNNAINEREKVIGKIETGFYEDVKVMTGILNPHEVSGVPIIKTLIDNSKKETLLTFIDCPPGSACIVMESIKDADFCLLVAEPTIFGVHNLNMVRELVELFNKPYGVILNKCVNEINPAEQYCIDNNIKVLGKIPYNNEIGFFNSNGQIIVKKSEEYHNLFTSLLNTIIKEINNEAIINT